MKKILVIATIALLVLMNARLLAQDSMALPKAPVSAAEYQNMQGGLDRALNKFRSNRDFGEISAGQLLKLLGIEISLVDLLLAAKTGQVIEELVVRRNDLLEQTIPSVVFLYDRILDLATYDAKLYDWKASSKSDKESLKNALNMQDKRTFLERARVRLLNYQTLIRDLQYKASIVPHMMG